jgi:multidrug resistance efflux pump
MKKVVLINILVLILLLAGGGAAVYYYNQSVNFVTTDNAQIDGQPVTISAIATGQLSDWNGEIGKTYNSGEKVGSISTGTSRVDIAFPVGSTIVQQSAVPNSFIAVGTPLARAYDLTHLYVTANINETDINRIKTGQAVDIHIDAFPGTNLTGKVNRLGLATANTFSMLPTSNTTSNFTKVVQVVPITITLDSYSGLAIVPGMSATVRIHM